MADLSVAEVLDRAADLIEPEGAWTQGALARTADGHEMLYISDILSDDAQCFCAFGALDRVLGRQAHLTPSLNQFCKVIGTIDVGNWNDAPDRTQAEVVAKLREAAALAREQGK